MAHHQIELIAWVINNAIFINIFSHDLQNAGIYSMYVISVSDEINTLLFKFEKSIKIKQVIINLI